ncbi:hypothetical protein T01_1988 [Trichinella spiralis]|uniref:Uncharacterized protein n=1 Tax=Trichinella spiralis TaxID=6334 RepID=A0A0V0Z021_TRISP|nr:hypothetical protein T01_1988 [Trichinella spiralis]
MHMEKKEEKWSKPRASEHAKHTCISSIAVGILLRALCAMQMP